MGAIILTGYKYKFGNCFLLIILLCIGSIGVVQASDIKLEATYSSLSVQDGLSGNSINTLFQDSRGFLWIGTQDGLNRYDGYSFEVYRHEIGDQTSISGNSIQCITEDANGDLWIGTIGNGLNKWNRKTQKFTVYSSKGYSNVNFPEDNILGISFDIDSTLWIKTDNFLVNFNTKTSEIVKYSLYSNIFKHHSSTNVPIFHKSLSYLWVGTYDGISQFNKQEKLYERIQFERSSETLLSSLGSITTIQPLSKKSILIGGSEGVFECSKNDSGLYELSKEDISNYKHSVVQCAVVHSSGGVWLGTNTGLHLLTFDYENEDLKYDPTDFYNMPNNLITDKEVTALIEDESGLLWVGTRYNGLIKVDFKPKKFKALANRSEQLKELQDCDVRSVYIDDGGKIWLGTANKGIKIVDPQAQDIYNYPVNYSLYKENKDIVLSMCQDSKQRLWIGTANGIYIYYKDRGTILPFTKVNDVEISSLLNQNAINSIEEDYRGNIWFGTQFGLYRYDGFKVISYFSDDDDEKTICGDEVNVIYNDSEGLLWIGTNNGVNYIDRKNEVFTGFEHLNNIKDSLPLLTGNHILSITEDGRRKIWFGTMSGISYYDKIKESIGYYSHLNGIANDMINSIVYDEAGIWIGTNKGISLIDKNQIIFNYDLNDGLPGYVFNKNATAIDHDGVIYFGGVSGVAHLNQDSLKFNHSKPNVVITAMELYHKGKMINEFRGDEKEILLKYRKSSNLKVKYAALEFTDPLRNKFQVYLEGFDDDWRTITTENEVDFSDLPSGEYVLHIKGANSEYEWTENPINISIKITPPIWMSNYAYAFYLIALIFLVQSIINYRIRHYKSAYKSLEEKAIDKKKIEAQKEMLSKINQSLTDSIYYAKRIQESILPEEKKIKSSLPDSFIYYRPKDLVSGDFYWLFERDDILYVAAVDCTGHGVPGAFMSIIAYDMLKSILTATDLTCPAMILDQLSKEVISTFKKDVDSNESRKQAVNDGMDIALCVIDKKNRKLTYSGAYNPLYLIRNNEIFVYKGDRFAIGYLSNTELHYSKHEIAIEPNDTFYIFSDGYADQFGGVEGKKFKYRRFRHLLLNIHKLPAEDQKAILHQKLEEWMGDFEQVDDIIVMGMKPIVELV